MTVGDVLQRLGQISKSIERAAGPGWCFRLGVEAIPAPRGAICTAAWEVSGTAERRPGMTMPVVERLTSRVLAECKRVGLPAEDDTIGDDEFIVTGLVELGRSGGK